MIQSGLYWGVLLFSIVTFWLLPERRRMPFLGVVSFALLLYFDFFSTCAVAGWTLLFFYLAPYVGTEGKKGRQLLVILILGITGFLAYFKYVPRLFAALAGDTLAADFLIPLGISYYTFKLIHYAVEVRKGTIVDRSLSSFFSYMLLFPIFTAGPIERYDHFLANRENRLSRESVVFGVTRIAHGLIKKLLIAGFFDFHALDRVPADALIRDMQDISIAKLWAYMVCHYLYWYFDFSAYSDIAIGSSRLFGIRIMENFNFPLLAKNIADFWKRWHISLGLWCQNYVYMPLLGMYRNPYVSLYASLIVFGLWHNGTWNRLAWGIYNATGVAIYTTWARWSRKRGWRPKAGILYVIPGMAFAQLWIVGGRPFLIAEDNGGLYQAIRLMARLIGINLA